MGSINIMFDSKHYIPILKWKRAEQSALETIEDKDKELMTPLIQFVMPKLTTKESIGKTSDELFNETIKKFQNKIEKIPEEILNFWGTKAVFIDFSLLYTTELKTETLEKVLLEANNKLFLIPVVHLDDDSKIIEITKKYRNGICLRLVCADLDDSQTLNVKIKKFLTVFGLDEKNIDLLVDIKETGEDSTKFNKYMDLSKDIPNLLMWRTFTFASGAFHEDLSKCKIDEENIIERLDWISWNNEIKKMDLLRKPSFGDYTIQYPVYKEATQFFAPTTSIKYALEEGWLILKGKKQQFDLYLANANILVGDPRFYGGAFSAGDKFIEEKSNHYGIYIKNPSIKGTGSTETWLTAGINHHLTVAVRQVANLL